MLRGCLPGRAISCWPSVRASNSKASLSRTTLILLPEFQKDMSGWIREGKLKWKETVEHGIENAPTAFLKLFRGENLGKMLVKLI